MPTQSWRDLNPKCTVECSIAGQNKSSDSWATKLFGVNKKYMSQHEHHDCIMYRLPFSAAPQRHVYNVLLAAKACL